MIIIGRPVNGITINGLEYVLDDSGELMKFESCKNAYSWLRGKGYFDRDIVNEGIQLIYTNERRECKCIECEKRADCYMRDKFQRLPPETTRGLGLGLCPKLQGE